MTICRNEAGVSAVTRISGRAGVASGAAGIEFGVVGVVEAGAVEIGFLHAVVVTVVSAAEVVVAVAHVALLGHVFLGRSFVGERLYLGVVQLVQTTVETGGQRWESFRHCKDQQQEESNLATAT